MTKETRVIEAFKSELLASEARIAEKFSLERVKEPWSAILNELKNNQKAINDRITAHLDGEEKAHGELFEEIKGIRKVIENTPIVNKAVLYIIGAITLAVIMGLVGLVVTKFKNFF